MPICIIVLREIKKLEKIYFPRIFIFFLSYFREFCFFINLEDELVYRDTWSWISRISSIYKIIQSFLILWQSLMKIDLILDSFLKVGKSDYSLKFQYWIKTLILGFTNIFASNINDHSFEINQNEYTSSKLQGNTNISHH